MGWIMTEDENVDIFDLFNGVAAQVERVQHKTKTR